MSRNRATSAHLSRVAALGCILCRRYGMPEAEAEIHHLREGRGGAQRGEDWTAVPLCPSCHRGPRGFHGLGKSAFERIHKVDELTLLAETLEAIYG